MRASELSLPDDDTPRRPCRWCAEMILPAAIVCRFCGRDVDPMPQAISVESTAGGRQADDEAAAAATASRGEMGTADDEVVSAGVGAGPLELANQLFEAIAALAEDAEDADAVLDADEVGREILAFEPGAVVDLPTATWRVVRRSAREIVDAINAEGEDPDKLNDILGAVACRVEADLRTAASRDATPGPGSSDPEAEASRRGHVEPTVKGPEPLDPMDATEVGGSKRPSEEEFARRLVARLALLKGDSRELAKAVLMSVTGCDLASATRAVDALPKSDEVWKCVEIAAIQGTLRRDIDQVVAREREKERRTTRGCAWTLGMAALALVVWLVIIPVVRTLSEPDNPEPETSEQTVDRVAAIDPCHDAVSAQLKSPSSAGFESWMTGEGDWTQTSETSGTYSGHVDAQNGFGAELRSEYTCEVTVDSDGDIVADATLIG